MGKIRVGILFGGKSSEHEVSLLSAKNVIEALDPDKYEPILIGIDKNGEWHLRDGYRFLIHAEDPKLIQLKGSQGHVAFVSKREGNQLVNLTEKQNSPFVDVVFPVLHGIYGEDGTIQGLLKLVDIPFVGAGVLGSAVGMDKDVMKRLLRDSGIPIAKFFTCLLHEKDKITFEEAVSRVGLPFFLKPANTGSSVGVSKIKNKEQFQASLKEAFLYDRKVIIEEYIPGREIECSVLGNEYPIASLPGEVIPAHEFYSYEAKYIDIMGAQFEIPVALSQDLIHKIQELSVQAFQALCCEGMARVDFFLKEDGTLYVNEINTIPGFTKISMYPKLWEVSGLPYSHLLDKLIQLAIERHKQEKSLITSYATDMV